MSKAEKKDKEPKKRGKYEEKLVVNGSFKDIMKAVSKDAANKKNQKKS